MLIRKEVRALANVLPKDDPSAFNLTCLNITEKLIEACNGHSLYWMTHDSRFKLNDFPFDHTPITDLPILVPGACLNKAIKNLPKKTSLQVLENIVVQETKDGIELITTDLDTTDKVACRINQKEASYPDTDRIRDILNCDEGRSVPLNMAVDQLEILLKVAKQSGAKYIEFSVGGETNPVAVEFNTSEEEMIHGALMPCGLDRNLAREEARKAYKLGQEECLIRNWLDFEGSIDDFMKTRKGE
jgi:hypothetical protein